MKSIKILLLMFYLFIPLHGMEALPPGTITLICIDGQEIYLKRSVADLSVTLKNMLLDLKIALDCSTSIPLENFYAATGPIVNAISLGMNMIACQLAHDLEASSKETVHNFIHELIDVISQSLDLSNCALPASIRRQTIIQLLSVTNYLNVPILLNAISCIAAQNNITKPHLPSLICSWAPEWLVPKDTTEICPDMENPIQQAKHFLGTNTHSFFVSDNAYFQNASDLAQWGLVPSSSLPKDDVLFDNYIIGLVCNKEFLMVQEIIDSLAEQCHGNVIQKIYSLFSICMHKIISNAIQDKELTELQNMLEEFVTNQQVELARLAYKALLEHVQKMTWDEIKELFNDPSLNESALRVMLRLRHMGLFIPLLDDNYQSPNNFRGLLNNGVDLKYILPTKATFNCHSLDVENLNLLNLPAEIFLLSYLIWINCNNNQLTDLPKELALCKQIRTLSLRANNLTAVPEVIFQLERLEDLDISSNNIRALPDELAKLTRLKMIYLDNTVQIPASFDHRTDIIFKCWDPTSQSWDDTDREEIFYYMEIMGLF